MSEQPETRIARRADGTWAPGQSGSPGGITSAEHDKIRAVRRYALERTYQATDRIIELMADDDSKVALAASIALLKLAGCFNEKALTDDALVARIQELAAEERARRAGR